MVNGKYVKNLPGRKTDMSDCQWQATLHAHGLLNLGFVLPEHSLVFRLQDWPAVAQRPHRWPVAMSSTCKRRWSGMNLKIHDVISDLTGDERPQHDRGHAPGGERNPVALLAL